MSAQTLDGKAIAADLKKVIKTKVEARIEQGLRRPGLAV
ncbi:MAG: bifunctional methylenetetrahydrofolate dehydrogenase/methenyltetrahydrofolate cyclohydrolase, partial [gamma proteobacterium endosymbiont of Lamellibrachia anaximandri]|nr:bifunctional methylenetetrahydrofolate dehydrogenase/methenyltetrahydrofolate cyclohydrolase [gamma proteobacterium endosymbiont of Lamellibrachia anaximandri]